MSQSINVSPDSMTKNSFPGFEDAPIQDHPAYKLFSSRLTKKIKTDNAVQHSKFFDLDSTGKTSVLFGYVIKKGSARNAKRHT